ncbi:MAG: hypothetical protein RL166_578 [Actinomycetota bacterium]
MRKKLTAIISTLALLVTVFSQVALVSNVASAAGNFALRFNGQSVVGSGMSQSATAPTLTKNFTISADVRWDGTGDYVGLVSRPSSDGNAAQTGYCLCMAQGKPALAMRMAGNAANRVFFSNTTLPVNRWATVKATYDGQVIRIYIDGTLTDTSTSFGVSTDAYASDQPLYLGREFNTSTNQFYVSRAFHGELDNVEISNGLYPASLTSLLKYTFSEGTGTTTYDSGPSGMTSNFGTTNPPTWVQGSDPMTLTYDPVYGGSPIVESHRPYDLVTTRSTSAFTRPGYTYSDWLIAPGTSTILPNFTWPMPLTSGVFTPHWTASSQTITYVPGLGTGSSLTRTAATDSNHTLITYATAQFTRAGYRQIGWEVDSVIYLQNSSLTVGASNLTATALWAPNDNSISFNLNGGTGTTPATITAATGTTITLPSNSGFSRSGYQFSRWSLGTGESEEESTTYQPGDIFRVPTTSATFFAKWTQLSYNLTYNITGATSGTQPSSVRPNSYSTVQLNSATQFSREGYTFAGWRDQDGTITAAGGSYSVTDHGVSLTATWAPISHRIVYAHSVAASGSLPTQANVDTDGQFTIASGSALSVPGYHFGGWRATGSQKIYKAGDVFNVGTSDVFLVAKWLPDSHTIRYLKQGGESGTVPADDTVLTGENVVVANAGTLTKPGYTFAGWKLVRTGQTYQTGATYMATTFDFVFVAEWSGNLQSITYALGSGLGTVPTVSGAHTGDDLTVADGTGLSRTGYTFVGWKTGDGRFFAPGDHFDVPSSSLVFTAEWIANIYNVKYFLTNGASGTLPAAQTAATDDNFNLPSTSGISRSGYTLQYWFDGLINTAPGGSYHQGAGDTNFNTAWLAANQHVTYSAGTGVGTPPTQADVQTDQDFTLPSPADLSKPGYNFSGWTLGSSAYREETTFTAQPNAMNFVASWTAKTHTISYAYAGGANGTLPETSYVQTDETYSVPASSLTKAGYDFAGWTDGTTTYTANQSLSVTASTPDQLVLYPRWTAQSHRITYALGQVSGTAPSQANLNTDTVLTVAVNTVNPAGFIFNGWSDGANLYQAGDQIVVGASDITLSAVWTPVYLRVTYLIGNGARGVLPEDRSIAYGSSVTLASGQNLNISGKRLAGWSDGVRTYKPGASIASLTQDTNLTAVWQSANLASTGTDRNALALTAGFAILLMVLGSLLQSSKRHKRRQ